MHRVATLVKAIGRHTGDKRFFGTAVRVAGTKISKGLSVGPFSWLTGGTSHPILPGQVVSPSSFPPYVEPGRTKIITLANGIRIASTASDDVFASIGLYVASGSIYETPASYGASCLLKNIAFKTRHDCTRTILNPCVETATALASREHMVYTLETVKPEYVPMMAKRLIDNVRSPELLFDEIDEELPKIKAEIGEAEYDPDSLLMDGLHGAAFYGALANPLVASESSICRLNRNVLNEFLKKNYTAPRMVLTVVGGNHEILKEADTLFSNLPMVVRPEEPKSVYVGGEYRRQAESSKTHLALAFEVPGGWYQEKFPLTLTILQMLLAGGGSFSDGCHGKEMYSNRRILKEFPQIEAFSVFSSVYKNTGLFGIQATTSPAFVRETIDVAANELLAVVSSGQVDQAELDRAKAAAKSALLTYLQFTDIELDDTGLQILTYGSRKDGTHFLSMINRITVEDIVSLANKIISTPLTMASWGDVSFVPSYDSVCSRFKEKMSP